MNLKTFLKNSFLIYLFTLTCIFPQGKVYLVLGSDTAIWDAMDVSKFQCTYNIELYTSPSSNTAAVMSEAFRNQITDSYGNKLKMTWWMMAGNIFRFASNNNVPLNNVMTLYLMKKYYNSELEHWGDELSLHYHTFAWTDYDGDGKYWWNQAKSFLETKEDFDLTLAQFLLEEKVFPVSFRSGWHYMDNDWQNYLNQILPYSLHNDWPAKRNTTLEPIDNVFDWSQSPSDFIPFHPSPGNYQIPGNSKGWNVRSKYMGNVTQQMMNDIFLKASQGTDQLACFWSHLPDKNFLNEIKHVDTLLRQASLSYPQVNYQFCTAAEAYQLWLKNSDNQKPDLQLSEQLNGDKINFLITSNEPIFQSNPFIAVKDIYERYLILNCEKISETSWRTNSSLAIKDLGKIAAAVADTSGNLSMVFKNYLPDDEYIDNGESKYTEIFGNWAASSNSAWNLDSRIATLIPGDSAKIRFKLNSDFSGLQNIFIQFPAISNHLDSVYFLLIRNGLVEDTIALPVSGDYFKWLYVLTTNIGSDDNTYLEMFAKNRTQVTKSLAADVLKITAYVRDKQLIPNKNFVDLGEIVVDDSSFFSIKVTNTGNSELVIDNVISTSGIVKAISKLPIVIPAFKKLDISLVLKPNSMGTFLDTVSIISNDPINPVYKIPITAKVQNYFRVVDNDDTEIYSETGAWYKSVAQAYGSSSRYAYIQTTPNGPTASFTFEVSKTGTYDLFEILPATVNSADNALYKILFNGNLIDSFHLNQNEGSSSWKKIGRYFFEKQSPISIKVIDSGESTSGPVIRADAFKLVLYEESTNIQENHVVSQPQQMQLYQNHPNPFNATTKIKFSIPFVQPHGNLRVQLIVYDVLGNEVALIINEELSHGDYEANFNAEKLSSGVYFIRLTAGSFVQERKMVLLK